MDSGAGECLCYNGFMSLQCADEEGKLVFAEDVREGLSRTDQKELPAKYLYDDLGSALFVAITHVPEYGLTRADERLLGELAPDLPNHFSTDVTVAELGSGSGRKTRLVLEAFAGRGKPEYWPIDVSGVALEMCRQSLYDVADVTGFQGTYIDGLRRAAAGRRDGRPILLLFLGSNIGNFDRYGAEDFLRELRGCLRTGDALLLGADLEKPVEELLLAYDDPAGVTAAFNRNVLGHINRELGADFDLRSFEHEVRYDTEHRRIEMHLRCLRDQTVHIPAADFTVDFRAGETIWTEASHKFTAEELTAVAARTGFRTEAAWLDHEWAFAENLWFAA